VDKDNSGNKATVGASISSSNLTIDAYGKGVWEESSGSNPPRDDEYYSYYQNDKTGGWTVQVKVTSQTTTSTDNQGHLKTIEPWAKSGIMVKNDISVSAEDNNAGDGKTGYCIIAVTPKYGVTFEYDNDADGYLDTRTYTGNGGSSTTFPVWLRLIKTVLATGGATFSGWYSTNGTDWTQVGTDRTISSALETQDVGVFVSAANDKTNNKTVFSDFCFEGVVTYSITAYSGANGTIKSGGVTVAAGSSQTFSVISGSNQVFSIEPNTGYKIDKVLVGTSSGDAAQVDLGTSTSYTFEAVTSAHYIAASFALITNAITATAGANGKITSGGVDATSSNSPYSFSVNYGSDKTFTITPDSGYKVSSLKVNNNAITTTGEYTFSTVTSAQSIECTFAAITYTVTATAGSGGSISPTIYENIASNDSRTFTVSPTTDYSVASFTLDGTAVALNSSNQYTLTNINADHVIEVAFTKTPTLKEDVAGCKGSVESGSSTGGFNAADFTLSNVTVKDTKIVLDTGSSAIDPNNIVIPFKQEVAVSFLYEGAGYESDLGYILKSDAVDASGNFLGWNNIPISKKHMIFHNVHDENDDGILDTTYGNGTVASGTAAPFPNTSESAIASYNDGTAAYPGIAFKPNNDGTVTTKDMRKVIGTFDAGTELVFFLTADQDWDTSSTSGVFFTKKAWNTDTYTATATATSTTSAYCTPLTGASYTDCSGNTASSFSRSSNSFYKKYELGTAMAEGSCSIDKGWLPQATIDRMNTYYGVTLSGTANLCIQYNQQYAHVIVGAPPADPNQWILGWEDLTGAGDSDHNDMVFRIERKTGGVAQLQSAKAPVLSSGVYYTAVTFEVYDNMPCAGETNITYWVSIDDGTNWKQVTTWDTIKNTVTGAVVTGWTPGSPQYTYRMVRIDFSALGLSGNKLIWKAQMESNMESKNYVTCSPEILNIKLTGDIAATGIFSRSSPVVQTNVIYAGTYETPAATWTEKILRGHLKATRLYDPAAPTNTSAVEIWDAGAVLNSKAIDSRTIYFPNITVSGAANEVLAYGDGTTKTFTGTLAHHPVVAETVRITNTIETFNDIHTDQLAGSAGGTGTINRFTGAYTITFNAPPSGPPVDETGVLISGATGVPIIANYSYYTVSGAPKLFTTANVTSAMLGLTKEDYVTGKGFTYDLNKDGKFDNVAYDGTGTADDSDGDWLVNWVRGYKDGSSTRKEWLLGAIDHSVPAVETPPGTPKWYFGTDITEDERTGYATFKEAQKERQTVVYVGARDGMLHAFDAGKLRWGDNDKTSFKENRGYFLWETKTVGTTTTTSPNYGTGDELWAFIPANLISRLKNNLMQAEDQSYVDASPTIADVYINGQWRTVLVCAEGNGGDSVFCLDVTVPSSPTFLWEFADPDLFRSRSSPTVGLGRMLVGGEAQWVAIFVSGKSNNSSLYPSVYIVNVQTGQLIERVYLNADTRGVGGVPSGQPAIVDSDGNGYIDRLYIGTDKGFMYKVNLPDNPKSSSGSNRITNCVINYDFDYVDSKGATQSITTLQQYHPIYASPAITINNTLSSTGDIQYNVKIFFGTGDSPYYNDNIDTTTTTYHFFAYKDTEAKGVCGSGVSLDWFYALPAGQRIWASAFSAAGNIYFGTSTAETEDPCNALIATSNKGQLYVFSTGGTQMHDAFDTGNIITSPLVEDEHLYFRTKDGLNSLGGSTYNNATVVTGTGKTEIISWKEISD